MLIYLVGIAATYYFCFATSLVAVCLWLGIHSHHQPAVGGAGGVLQHIMDGLSFIRHNEIYYTFISMTFFNSVFGMSYIIMMPIFARSILSVGSQGFGFLQSAGGAGALFGVLLAAYFAHVRRKGMQAIAGAVVFGILLVMFAYSPWYSLSLALALLLGVSSQFYITTINAILQVNVPDSLRGRVMGIYGLTWDLMPVGGMIAGVIAEFGGAPLAVAVGGAFVAAMALATAVFLPNVRRLEQ
jgi:MFS family permease